MRYPIRDLTTALVSAGLCTTALAAPASPAGGTSAAHASATAATRSNGPDATDRDSGQARAADMRSVSGTAHDKATSHASGKKSHTHHSTHAATHATAQHR